MSQWCQVVSTLRNMNQITANETNGVSFLLSKCEPPAGLLCTTGGIELPQDIAWLDIVQQKSTKMISSLEKPICA